MVMESEDKKFETVLPLSRIRTIMKSSLNTGILNKDVLFVLTKATELFVQNLTKEAYKEGTMLRYEHLANFTQKEDNLEFLLQIIPQKIKVKDFKRVLEENGSASGSEDDDGSID